MNHYKLKVDSGVLRNKLQEFKDNGHFGILIFIDKGKWVIGPIRNNYSYVGELHRFFKDEELYEIGNSNGIVNNHSLLFSKGNPIDYVFFNIDNLINLCTFNINAGGANEIQFSEIVIDWVATDIAFHVSSRVDSTMIYSSLKAEVPNVSGSGNIIPMIAVGLPCPPVWFDNLNQRPTEGNSD